MPKWALKMEKECIFHGPVWCSSSRCMLPSSMEVFTPFKLHQHSPVIYPGSDQVVQTLLPQSQQVKSPISMTDHTLFHDPCWCRHLLQQKMTGVS